MPFNPAIPQPTNLLSNSQGDLLANNGFLNTWSLTDHYALDDATVNNGKHKVLQMPVQATQPVTVTDPMFYSFAQPAGNAGILQYVCQAGGLVQSPVTPIQSAANGISLPPNTPTTVFDFTSMPYCFGYVNGMGTGPSPFDVPYVYGTFYWTGSKGAAVTIASIIPNLTIEFVGSFLKINNGPGVTTFSKFSWTLQFDRIFTPL